MVKVSILIFNQLWHTKKINSKIPVSFFLQINYVVAPKLLYICHGSLF